MEIMSQLDRTNDDDDVIDYSAENMYREFENSTAATVRRSTCQETAKSTVPKVEESPPLKRLKREPPSSDFCAKFSKLASEYSKDCVRSAYKKNTRSATAANESPVRTPDRNLEAATTTGSDTIVNDAPRHDDISQNDDTQKRDEVSQGDDVLLRGTVKHADTSQYADTSKLDEASQGDDVLLRGKVEHDDTSQHEEVSQGDDVSLRVKVEHADTSQHNEASQHEEASQREDVLLRVKVEPDDVSGNRV